MCEGKKGLRNGRKRIEEEERRIRVGERGREEEKVGGGRTEG